MYRSSSSSVSFYFFYWVVKKRNWLTPGEREWNSFIFIKPTHRIPVTTGIILSENYSKFEKGEKENVEEINDDSVSKTLLIADRNSSRKSR